MATVSSSRRTVESRPAGKLVSAYVGGGQISVLVDGNKRASAYAAASLISLVPPRRVTTVTDAPVQAIYPADDDHRQWCTASWNARPGRRRARQAVKFDDRPADTVAVLGVQCALTISGWVTTDGRVYNACATPF
jgi:hypothetical protein